MDSLLVRLWTKQISPYVINSLPSNNPGPGKNWETVCVTDVKIRAQLPRVVSVYLIQEFVQGPGGSSPRKHG